MESPLTVFLYVLMRDHLPTGTVRWLIEQSQLDGDPAFSAPELEALAERYAAELLLAPPRKTGASDSSTSIEEPKPPPPEEPEEATEPLPDFPTPTGTNAERVLSYLAFREEHGQPWCKFNAIVGAIGRSGRGCRFTLQGLVRNGEVIAEGATSTRRYRLGSVPEPEPETSQPDHDDSGEGDVPGDPEGDEGVRAADPPDDETLTAEDGGSDGEAPESGSASSAAIGALARGPKEEDVELMARVGDYIKESDSPVFAGEIEAIFGLGPERRRRIIEMLLDRHRIEQRGNPPRATYVPRSSPVPDADALGPLSTPGHFRPSPKQEREQLPADAEAKVKSWAVGQRTFKKRTVIEAFPDLDSTLVGPMLSRLAGEGFLVPRNEDGSLGGGISYEVANSHREVNGNLGVTLEGRLMGILDGTWVTADALAAKAHVSRDDAVIALDKLVGEGMIRRDRPTRTSSAVYAAT